MNLSNNNKTMVDKPQLTTLAKGSSVTFSYRVIGRILIVLIQILIARVYGPEGYGLYAIGWVISRIIWSFSTLGLQNGVIKFGIESYEKNIPVFKGIVYNAMSSSFIIGIILMLIFFFSADYIAINFYDNQGLSKIIKIFSLSFPFLSLITITASLSRITMKMKYGTLIEDFLPPTINLIILSICIFLGFSIQAAAISCVLGYLGAFIASIYFLKKLFPILFTKSSYVNSYKKLFVFSLPTVLSGTFSFLTTRLSRLILGVYTGASSVGIYQAASQNIVSANVISNAFRTIFAPIIADLVAKGDFEEVDKMYKTSTRWILYLNMSLFLMFWLSASELLTVLFGKEFSSAAIVLVILSIGQFVNTLAGPVAQLMIMSRFQNQWMILSAVAFTLNLILCFVLIPKYESIGAAIAVSLVNAILHILGVIYIRFKLEITPYDYRILNGFIAGILAYLGTFVLISFFDMEVAIVKLIFSSIVSTTIFFSVIYFLGISEEDKYVLDLVKRKIKWNKKI
jgi:O-antigen/teichoic acid export membrane protein